MSYYSETGRGAVHTAGKQARLPVTTRCALPGRVHAPLCWCGVGVRMAGVRWGWAPRSATLTPRRLLGPLALDQQELRVAALGLGLWAGW